MYSIELQINVLSCLSHCAQEFEREKERRSLRLPPEPSLADPSSTVHINLKMPDGVRLERKFQDTDKLEVCVAVPGSVGAAFWEGTRGGFCPPPGLFAISLPNFHELMESHINKDCIVEKSLYWPLGNELHTCTYSQI